MAKSEYLKREEAAKKQLGAKGVKKRVKQLPTAARASLREMTGIDVSRKGVSVDPMGVAMALPLGKVVKAARALRAAGQVGKAEAVMSRAAAKIKGQKIGREFSYFDEPVDFARESRVRSEAVFPRATRSNVSEGTMNIVDTRRMNPAQAKSALEGGVNQTTKINRRVPSAPKKVNKVTKRLLGGR